MQLIDPQIPARERLVTELGLINEVRLLNFKDIEPKPEMVQAIRLLQSEGRGAVESHVEDQEIRCYLYRDSIQFKLYGGIFKTLFTSQIDPVHYGAWVLQVHCVLLHHTDKDIFSVAGLSSDDAGNAYLIYEFEHPDDHTAETLAVVAKEMLMSMRVIHTLLETLHEHLGLAGTIKFMEESVLNPSVLETKPEIDMSLFTEMAGEGRPS